MLIASPYRCNNNTNNKKSDPLLAYDGSSARKKTFSTGIQPLVCVRRLVKQSEGAVLVAEELGIGATLDESAL